MPRSHSAGRVPELSHSSALAFLPIGFPQNWHLLRSMRVTSDQGADIVPGD